MSKKNIIKPQYEEFWDDCIKITPKKNIKFNEDSFNIEKPKTIELQKNKKNKIIFRQNLSSVKSKNHRLIKKVLTTEESITKSIEEKKQKQINILTSLYNIHLLKKKKAQNETKKLKENLILKEKQDCPFKPKNYTNYRSISEKYSNKKNTKKKIYERVQEDKDKRYYKLKKIKHQSHKKDKIEYPFQPEIRHNNFRRILYGINFWEEMANNISNEIFLRRYKKAREEENEKKKKLSLNCYEINESINDEGNKRRKKIYKSISQKNSLMYRQTLHNYLLEYETNDEDNLDENKKNNNNKYNINNVNYKIIKILKN